MVLSHHLLHPGKIIAVRRHHILWMMTTKMMMTRIMGAMMTVIAMNVEWDLLQPAQPQTLAVLLIRPVCFVKEKDSQIVRTT